MKQKLTVLLLALALALSLPAAAAPVFADVPSDAYYAQAVNWAVERGITAGTSDTTFSPDQTCTRGQIITFLWRASGSPAPSAQEGVRDIGQNDYFYRAVLWAKEKGLFEGDAFRPNDPCTRLAAVEFMWNKLSDDYTGQSLEPEAGFTDVTSRAVNWALARGVTAGTSDTTFSPDQTCTRGQIVAMLHRDAALDPQGTYLHENGYYRLKLEKGGRFALYLAEDFLKDPEYSNDFDLSDLEEPILDGKLVGGSTRLAWGGVSIFLYQDYIIVTEMLDLSEGMPRPMTGKYIRQAD